MNGTKPDSSLIFNGVDPGPGVHALMIGVSAYAFIKGGTAIPSTPVMANLAQQLDQLVGPAQSARDLADFLIARKDKLTKPLRTVRLVASPSPDETKDNPAFDGIPPATSDNIVTALNNWKNDASRSNDEVALFYFGGHGSQRSKTNALLLPHDFLGGFAMFDKTIDVMDIWSGMAPDNKGSSIAQTQFYFIDACRDDEDVYRDFQKTGMRQPFDVRELGTDERVAPIFYASGPGQQTKADVVHKTTRFGSRLLLCLKGAGGEALQQHGWVVTVNKLANALDTLSAYARLGGERDSFRADKLGGGRTIIHRLDEPPKVPCIFRFNGNARKGHAMVLQTLTTGTQTIPPELDDPHRKEIVAGHYAISPNPTGLFPLSEIDILPPLKDLEMTRTEVLDASLNQEE
jgi:Caspase domain